MKRFHKFQESPMETKNEGMDFEEKPDAHSNFTVNKRIVTSQERGLDDLEKDREEGERETRKVTIETIWGIFKWRGKPRLGGKEKEAKYLPEDDYLFVLIEDNSSEFLVPIADILHLSNSQVIELASTLPINQLSPQMEIVLTTRMAKYNISNKEWDVNKKATKSFMKIKRGIEQNNRREVDDEVGRFWTLGYAYLELKQKKLRMKHDTQLVKGIPWRIKKAQDG